MLLDEVDKIKDHIFFAGGSIPWEDFIELMAVPYFHYVLGVYAYTVLIDDEISILLWKVMESRQTLWVEVEDIGKRDILQVGEGYWHFLQI